MISKRIHAFDILKIAILLIALLIVVVPFSYLFLNSIKHEKDFRGTPLRILPTEVTLKHYRKALDPDSNISSYFKNTIIVTSFSVAISIVFGTFAAYGFSKTKKRFRIISAVTYMILLVRFYPKVALIIPYFILMKNLFLIDTVLAVIIAHVSIELPFVIWLMIGFYDDVPREIEESAVLDGCNHWDIFTRIIFPITVPGVATAAIMSALLSWNEFLIASSVTAMKAKTLPIVISGYISDKGIDWGPMSAIGVVIVLPMFLFALCAQKYLISGLTFGAVKG